MGCSKPGCPSRQRESPRAPAAACSQPRRGRLGEELGKICSEQGVFPRGPSRAEGKGGTLPEHGPALCHRAVPSPKESRVVTGLPRTTAKKKTQTHENAPPNPLQNPNLTLRLMLPLNKPAYIFHRNTVKKERIAPNPRLLTRNKRFSI